MIYLIKGKNGAGKTFLANHLYELGYNRSVSCTTRDPRENEIEGYDYYFITKEEFEKRIREGYFAEYQSVNGIYYGTPTENLKDGVIIVSSVKNMIERYYKGDITTFYIDAPLELRYKRVLERGTSENEIFRRFTKENSSFLYDFNACFIDNGNETQSLGQIINGMKSPKSISNRSFLRQKVEDYTPLNTNDELLTFLQFEEFLMRGLYLDNRIYKEDIDKKYFEYMQKFLKYKNIGFEQVENGVYGVILNGYNYYYTINKNKINKKGERYDEKEID